MWIQQCLIWVMSPGDRDQASRIEERSEGWSWTKRVRSGRLQPLSGTNWGKMPCRTVAKTVWSSILLSLTAAYIPVAFSASGLAEQPTCRRDEHAFMTSHQVRWKPLLWTTARLMHEHKILAV